MIRTSAAWLFCPMPKDSPRESQKFFEASTSRSFISLFGQFQTYLKNQKTRSGKRLPEESRTRSNVKIVIVFTSSDIVCAKNTHQRARKGQLATLDENSLFAKHHMCHSHQIELLSLEIVDRSSAWQQRLILEAWHSVRDTNAINEHISLPNIYSIAFTA